MSVDGRGWDTDVLNDVLNERDKNLLLKIPFSHYAQKDELIWFKDPRGCFTTKSCYRLIMEELQLDTNVIWRQIWNLKVPSKV